MTRVDRIRGLGIGLLLVLMVLFALPTPLPLDERRMALPAARAELQRWRPVFAAAGLTEDEAVALLARGVGSWRSVLQVVRAPFRPVLGALGVDQRWALFAQADEVPARLSVVVQRGGEEALVYRRLDPGHAMFADLLAYRRVRGVYDLSGTAATPSFRRLADALWARVRVEDDGADGLVLKLVRRTTAPPGGVADPTPVSSVHAAVGEVP